jgi:hypothetical protein
MNSAEEIEMRDVQIGAMINGNILSEELWIADVPVIQRIKVDRVTSNGALTYVDDTRRLQWRYDMCWQHIS